MADCAVCQNMRVIVERRGDGTTFSRDCECRRILRLENMLAKSGMPKLYQASSFENFTLAGVSPSIHRAHLMATRYVEEFPLDRSRGLLLVGPVGVGKTHIAIATIRQLTVEYGTRTYFTDFRELLRRIQATFNNAGATREDVMRPVIEAELLVLDELGAARVTDWTYEIAEEIINARYNNAAATIFTTNLPNRGAGENIRPAPSGSYSRPAHDAMRAETLGDRLGERMFSRLQQMSAAVEIAGEDYRRKRA
jgi:DNA replication protein DnaC